MERSRVRYFLAVCQHRSFIAAAKACGVTQPTISTAVRRLERAIGGQLLERRHPLRLTPLAREIQPLLETLHATAESIAKIVERHQGASTMETSRKLEDRTRRTARAWPRLAMASRRNRA